MLLPAHVDAYGSQRGLHTGPFAPPSSMQRRPASQAPPGLQICPAPPESVQVCAAGSQPMPFAQSLSAPHCTQLPLMHTGVVSGQSRLLVQPVVWTTQVLLLVHTCPLGQSVLWMHCTQSGYGETRQSGVAGGQSCACVATVHTGAHDPPAQRYPFPHCAATMHCTQVVIERLQYGVPFSDAQSASVAQVTEAQVLLAVQVLPAPQFAAVRQATQTRVSVLQ